MQVEPDRTKRIVFKEVPWSQKDDCATFYHAHCNYNCMQYKLDTCLILHCLWQTVFKILVCKSEPIVLCYIMELKWFNMFVSLVNVRWCLTWRKFGFCPWGLTGSYTIRNWWAGDPFCKHVLLNCVVRSKSLEHFMSINGALAPTVAHFPWCSKRFRLIFSNDTSLYLEYLISKAEAWQVVK